MWARPGEILSLTSELPATQDPESFTQRLRSEIGAVGEGREHKPRQDDGAHQCQAGTVSDMLGPFLPESVDARDEEQDREVQGGEVVMEVELAAHVEEGRIVDSPSSKESPRGHRIKRSNTF